MKMVWKTTPLYAEAEINGQPGLLMYPGLWKQLLDFLQEKGHSVLVLDKRTPLPMPKIGLAMEKLRPWQKSWILKALLQNESGMLGAPTRYGKTFGALALVTAHPECNIVITAPGTALCRQLFDFFTEQVGGHRDVSGIFDGSKGKQQAKKKKKKGTGGVTICSMDSLYKIQADTVQILIGDEIHASVTDTRLPFFADFMTARRYGFGATRSGRSDKRDRLIEAVWGPELVNVSYREAVAQSAISPLKVVLIRVPFSFESLLGCPDRNAAYNQLLFRSPRVAKLVKDMLTTFIPLDWQTMAFIDNEQQAEFYLEKAMPKVGTIAMAKRMNGKQLDTLTQSIADGTVWRVLASKIYVQGLTFPELKVVFNLAGGGANTTAIQKPGRLLQKLDGKNYGVMVDFLFDCTDSHLDNRKQVGYQDVVRDSLARQQVYVDIGYDVEIVDDETRLVEIIKNAYA